MARPTYHGLMLAAHASAAWSLGVQGDLRGGAQEGRLGLQDFPEVSAENRRHVEGLAVEAAKEGFVKFMQEDFLWHMLVDPKHKMMACKNYKAGSSELSHLFSVLWDDPDRVALHRNNNWTRSVAGCKWFKKKWADFPVDQPTKCDGMPAEAITLHQFKPIETNATGIIHDWYKVMVARDPLDRFISGILEKCGTHLNTSEACPAKRDVVSYLNMNGSSWPALNDTSREAKLIRKDVMLMVLETLEQLAHRERQKGKHWGYGAVDPHFRPPSSMCGAGHGLRFNHVILYDPRDFSDKVENLLHKIGAEDAHQLREKFDMLSNNTQLTSDRWATAADRIKDMLTPDMASRLIWLYAEDYMAFPTMRDRIPGWASHESHPLPDWHNFEASMKEHYESSTTPSPSRKMRLRPLPIKVDMSTEED